MQRFILAIDQGTTGTTALLFDHNLNIFTSATVNFPQYFPKPNWVEHDLNEIWNSVVSAVQQVVSKVPSGDRIEAIGITNQRETTCLWERDGEANPVGRAIVWQDRRTSDHCDKLKKAGLEKQVRAHTGLLLDPYFSATKLGWMLKNIAGAKAKARTGKLAFGTIESYLLYRMSGKHFTEPSNACRTY